MTFAEDRDPWARQPGETGEAFDWFSHWRNDGHRRSYARVAERFAVSYRRVVGAARRGEWQARLDAYRTANSAALRERATELIEQGLAPFAQGFARMSALAVTGPADRVPPDRALAAAATALRTLRDPVVRELLRAPEEPEQTREIDLVELVLDQLAQRWPEAHDAVLDALRNAVDTNPAG
ncbi:hypothetical protein GCM10010174_26020 [Kutzneria viridogrisea]|uniref:Uncharacterized protein n=1 Tax=Kutzneria viridogrisea TaxID=47990 RepID=A0ABR6BSA8_9PSEU|nr:hypothetical protein [Kutzneria viridogrisea]